MVIRSRINQKIHTVWRKKNNEIDGWIMIDKFQEVGRHRIRSLVMSLPMSRTNLALDPHQIRNGKCFYENVLIYFFYHNFSVKPYSAYVSTVLKAKILIWESVLFYDLIMVFIPIFWYIPGFHTYLLVHINLCFTHLKTVEYYETLQKWLFCFMYLLFFLSGFFTKLGQHLLVFCK